MRLQSKESSTKLIVGLGNPGLEYKNTRHNLGAAVVERIAEENKVRLKKSYYLASKIAFCKIEGIDCLLSFPQEFMNCSGRALKKLIMFKKFDLENILVIYDDLDLELGVIRFKKNGSSAGHKGVQSIIDELQTKEFNRLRLGIGKPENKDLISDYVLGEFYDYEKGKVNLMIDRSIKACRFWVKYGIEKSMNKFN